MKQWLPLSLLAVFGVWVISALVPPRDKPDGLALEAFGRLPILSNGRVQPLDSLARNSLLELRHKQTASLDPWKGMSATVIPATQWLLTMMANPEAADAIPVFRIDHPQLKGLLGLAMEADPEKKADGKHFSFEQIRTKLEELQKEARRAGAIDSSKQNTYDQAVIHLFTGIALYMRLQNVLEPQNAKDWQAELKSYLDNIPAGVTAARAQQAKKDFDQVALDRLMTDFQRFDAMNQLEPPLIVPPSHPETNRDDWRRMGDALMNVARGEPVPFAVEAYAHIATAFKSAARAEDAIARRRAEKPSEPLTELIAAKSKAVADFNQAVADYTAALADQQFTPELKKTSQEQYFNNFDPFYKALLIYVVVGLCAIGFWFNPAGLEWLRRAAMWLLVLALVVHTGGLFFRIVLQGRPPVTNLYSSAIFIGWGACILGLVLESFWRNSIGLVVSAVVGFLTLLIAQYLALSGDTMEMMRAVLDTNFWLATHVTTVTLGYASTFVAGFLAILYVILGVFTPLLSSRVNERSIVVPGGAAVGGTPGALAAIAATSKTPKKETTIGRGIATMVYGIVCFATLFSFVGTILGGIWADQSWGRFWGWDPKENGALIIVLWNALILHARWGGLVRERGLINLAIGGNIVTAWSWFGVNMLGIGLHSYGFTNAAFFWLSAFVSSQLALIALGCLPLRFWRSFAPASAAEPPIAPLPHPVG